MKTHEERRDEAGARSRSQQALRLLTAEDLSIGRNIIRHIADVTWKRWSFALFEIVSESITAGVRELLVLHKDEVQGQEDGTAGSFRESLIQKVSSLDDQLGIILATDSLELERGLREHDERVRVVSLNELFNRIINVPIELDATIRYNLLQSVDTKHFEFYHQREATVLSSPGGLEVGTVIENLSDYLEGWTRSSRPGNPLILMGERGSGKSWELVKYCLDSLTRMRNDPWLYGPGLYIGLRRLLSRIRSGDSAFSPLLGYLMSSYRSLSLLHDAPMLSSFIHSGQMVLCFDGLDEVAPQASDEAVQVHLASLLDQLSTKSKFIITCRTSHFSSVGALESLRAWAGLSIGDTFDILLLRPFSKRAVSSVMRKVSEAAESAKDLQKLDFLVNPTGDPEIGEALRTMAQHPALLSAMMQTPESDLRTISGTERIGECIIRNLVDYNLRFGRTVDQFPRGEGMIDLRLERRVEILEEIAWYMAERSLDALEFAQVPRKLFHLYQLEGDELRRDLRSQTVFELRTENGSNKESVKHEDGVVEGRPSSIQFTLRRSQGDLLASAKVGSTSIAGAYFLARYLARSLKQSHPIDGQLALQQRLRPFGRIRIGNLCAALLREMLEEQAPMVISELREGSLEVMKDLANKGLFEIFSPWYRNLFSNLETMGLVAEDDRVKWDPWTEDTTLVLSSPRLEQTYELALIPASTKPEEPQRPFLLGVHEVTNRMFQRFIQEGPRGSLWSVESITIAGRTKGRPVSPYAGLSNEYHLYFWRKPQESGAGFSPPRTIWQTPVTYVSWYACGAYCDWLSEGEGRAGRYLEEREELAAAAPEAPDRFLGDGRQYHEDELGSFRLPRAHEWTWAARGGHSDLQYPWEMFPYYLSRDERNRVLAGNSTSTTSYAAAEDYRLRQDAARRVLLETGKDPEEVMYDEFSDFGVSGLLGNVKEWCDDLTLEGGRAKRLILGATMYLEEPTFDFDYQVPLYPENTNPDVGFRIARSLTDSEIAALERRQEQIAAQSL